MPDIKRENLVVFLLAHLIAALALLPWFFSWTGMWLFGAGVFLFGTLGIDVGFHRLLAHRDFECPRWLERLLAILRTACLQFLPAFWVAVHRRHARAFDPAAELHHRLRGAVRSAGRFLVCRCRAQPRGRDAIMATAMAQSGPHRAMSEV